MAIQRQRFLQKNMQTGQLRSEETICRDSTACYYTSTNKLKLSKIAVIVLLAKHSHLTNNQQCKRHIFLKRLIIYGI